MAIGLLGRYLATAPDDGRAWFQLGRFYLLDARDWHLQGHRGDPDGLLYLDFAATAFDQAVRLSVDSGVVFRGLAELERSVVFLEDSGWSAGAGSGPASDAPPMPPFILELGANLLASCPVGGVLLVGTDLEALSVWYDNGDLRSREILPLRPALYATDSLYRRRMAEAMETDPGLPIRNALAGGRGPPAALPVAHGRQRGRPRAHLDPIPPGPGEPAGAARSGSALGHRAAGRHAPGRLGLGRRGPRRVRRRGPLQRPPLQQLPPRVRRRAPAGMPPVGDEPDGEVAFEHYTSPFDVQPPQSSGPLRSMKRVLIANRGEIALRIIRACHEEGLEAVAVYSAADRRQRPRARRRSADRHRPRRAVRELSLHRAPDRRRPRIRRRRGAPRLRLPGRARRVRRSGRGRRADLGGTAAAAIRAMGDKTEARRRMREAGVPVVPGAASRSPIPSRRLSLAEEIGYPVMVKAVGGWRRARACGWCGTPVALPAALETAASEALKAFGDAGVYLEKFIERPRHIEIQVLADDERTMHLGERECSIQRRHQKLVEEAPSLALSADLREWMGSAAVSAAQAVGYRGAGTCEFLLTDDNSFYFLEMNTRIQVEHPVTELVYGVDLVREQLRIARGRADAGPRRVARIRGAGPSSAGSPARIRPTASCPPPAASNISRVPAGPGVRWDSGVEIGDEVTLYYDSLLAKLIVWAPDRRQAIARMSAGSG